MVLRDNRLKRHAEGVLVAVGALVVIAIALGIYARSGLYDIGADDHHWAVTYDILKSVRDRSVRERSKDLRPPNLPVAFLQKLPDLSPQEYKDMVAKAPPDEDMDMNSEKGRD